MLEQMISHKMTDESGYEDYEWLQVMAGKYKWLRETTSQTTSDYMWLQVCTSQTTNNYKWLRATSDTWL